MIDEEAPPDIGAGMDLDARQKTRDLRNHTRDQRYAGVVKFVRQPVQQNRMKTWVTEEYLENTFGRRVFPEDGVDLLSNGPKHGILPAFLDDYAPQMVASVHGWLRVPGLSSRTA